MKKYGDTIGKIYLYLFSMLGLILIIIGATGLINLGLKNLVFDTTDPWAAQPPLPRFTTNIETMTTWDELTEEDKQLLENWLEDYEEWKENSNRLHRQYQNNESIARNLSLLFVGLPLFIFHWRLVRKKY